MFFSYMIEIINFLNLFGIGCLQPAFLRTLGCCLLASRINRLTSCNPVDTIKAMSLFKFLRMVPRGVLNVSS